MTDTSARCWATSSHQHEPTTCAHCGHCADCGELPQPPPDPWALLEQSPMLSLSNSFDDFQNALIQWRVAVKGALKWHAEHPDPEPPLGAIERLRIYNLEEALRRTQMQREEFRNMATQLQTEVNSLHNQLGQCEAEKRNIINAVRNVYYSARWQADRPVRNAASLWAALRDACGLTPGGSR